MRSPPYKRPECPPLAYSHNAWVHENLFHPVSPIRNPRCQENVEYPVFVREGVGRRT